VIEVGDAGSPAFGPDVVVFVGEPQSAHTEIGAALLDGEPVAFVPLPRYGGGFGLAQIGFGREPRLDSPARWTMYPQASDRAHTAVASLHGRPWIAYVRAADASDGAGRTLALASLAEEGTGAEIVVDEAARFTSLSLVSNEGPRCRLGFIAWTADGRGWARAIRCK
jgi:hypothetical protein